ncbi:hypothetical protein NQ317_013320 [Molorchus minor]|uniref:Uncharacterized protein n=1 Tax=Molorchus minor TaxID=1323400 RepID=A0ABQ9K095_9CUCU|nr:hypothetical protein NQ317_013320 [Molorchus minor]
MRTETLLKQVFMMDVFIGFAVDANIYNGSENVIYIGLPYNTCPLPRKRRQQRHAKYADDKNDGEQDDEETQNQAVLDIMKFIIKEIIKNNTDTLPNDMVLQESIDVIRNISDFIIELNFNYTNPEMDEEDTYTTTFSKLQSLTDDFLDEPQPDIWIKYFNFLFMGTNVTINPNTDLLYTTEWEIQYLLRILHFILGTSDTHIELYMWWVTIYAMIINTSSDIVTYITRQMTYYGSSSSSIARSRSLECALLVNNYMGYAISYALADRSFPNKTKPKVDRMINDIKDAFVQHVNHITWMDSETKKVTLEKSREMITFVGDNKAGYLLGKHDKYHNFPQFKKKFVTLRIKHKRDWYSEPIEVNAFNSFSDNAINIPMAIISFPMYNLGLEVLNYGSIGAILGHELTHGFDNMGIKYKFCCIDLDYNLAHIECCLGKIKSGNIFAKYFFQINGLCPFWYLQNQSQDFLHFKISEIEIPYSFKIYLCITIKVIDILKHDKYGNYVQWWTNKTIESFEELTECFVEQYDNFTIEGVEQNIKGTYTLAENLADNGD